MQYVLECSRVTLLVVFAAAATGKLTRSGFRDFSYATSELAQMSRRRALIAASMVLGLELMTLGLLLIPSTTLFGLVLAATLLASFTGVLIRAISRGRTASCHCFGSSGAPVGWTHVFRNSTMVGIAAVGICFSAAGSRAPIVPEGWVAPVVCASIFLAALLVRWEDTVFLLRGARADEMEQVIGLNS